MIKKQSCVILFFSICLCFGISVIQAQNLSGPVKGLKEKITEQVKTEKLSMAELSKGTTDYIVMEKYIPKVIVEGKWGTEPGEFGLGNGLGQGGGNIYPKEFVFDDNGNIYVSDRYNNRIQKFDPNGKFIEMYPVEIFVLPTDNPLTDNEFDESIKTWNKHAMYFEKVSADGLAWLNGQLYISQKRMSDVHIKKYDKKILVLKSGKFAEATDKEYKIYESAGVGDRIDAEGNRYRREEEPYFKWIKYKKDINARDITDVKGNRYITSDDGVWEKQDKNGRKIFEFKTFKEHKEWFNIPDYSRTIINNRSLTSVIHFDRNGDYFYEMEVFSVDDTNWCHAFLLDGGGIRIIRWTLKK